MAPICSHLNNLPKSRLPKICWGIVFYLWAQKIFRKFTFSYRAVIWLLLDINIWDLQKYGNGSIQQLFPQVIKAGLIIWLHKKSNGSHHLHKSWHIFPNLSSKRTQKYSFQKQTNMFYRSSRNTGCWWAAVDTLASKHVKCAKGFSQTRSILQQKYCIFQHATYVYV